MIHINWISSIGLILDILGVILLFSYGLPSNITSQIVGLKIGEVRGEQKKQIDRKNKKIKIFANLAILLIIAGFILQLIGTNYS